MSETFPSVWGSVVKTINDDIIDPLSLVYTANTINFVDWDAHANIEELPNTDLIGPSAFTMTETSPQMFDVSFAVAVSTYQDDTNLFRLRAYLSKIFERLRSMNKIKIYNSDTGVEFGVLTLTDGTLLSPMTRADARSWQYVQTSGLLTPSSEYA